MNSSEMEFRLAAAGIGSRRLGGAAGGAIVCGPGARLLGIWLGPDGKNILWTNPALSTAISRGDWTDFENGGLGGDRIWFGPEYRYHFEDAAGPRGNYRVQRACDGGNYRFTEPAQSAVGLAQHSALHAVGRETPVGFSYEREFSLSLPPRLNGAAGLSSFGLRVDQRLVLQPGEPGAEIDAWNILQVPVGAWMLVPTRGRPRPTVAVGPRGKSTPWTCAGDHLRWHVRGDTLSKIAFEVQDVTGRMGIVCRQDGGGAALLVKSFQPEPDRHYGDAVTEEQISAQCVQLFDGYGFGELEYHTPTATRQSPRVEDTQLIWCFSGPASAVEAVAEELLERRFPPEVFA
jgi:hypothetical protein